MRKSIILSLFIMFSVLLTQGILAQETSLDIRGLANYSAGEVVSGTMTLSYYEYIPRTTNLKAYIDGELTSTIPLYGYLHDPGYYLFQGAEFDYNITAQGQNTWSIYPTIPFDYVIKAEGTCGGEYCCPSTPCFCECPCGDVNNPLSFPCDWSVEFPSSGTLSSSVNKNNNLKIVRDASASISLPIDKNQDTFWSEIYNPDSRVETTMREACGSQSYGGSSALPNGWVWLPLNPATWTQIPASSDRYTTMDEFDNISLGPGYSRFGGGPGGIYKTLGGEPDYQNFGTDVEWEGSTGYVRINNYDHQAVYIMKFLPPNGPKLCAYTSYKEISTSEWTKSVEVMNKITTQGAPYAHNYTDNELASLLKAPSCPSGSVECNQTVLTYTAVKTRDPTDTVTLFYEADEKIISAETTLTQLATMYWDTIDIENFNLQAPAQIGSHILELKLEDSQAQNSSTFHTCVDQDGDGYCIETGDCDDSNHRVFPGASEVCNGKDDDCDGEIDEDYWQAGSKIGNPCGVGACEGYFVCTLDGSNVTCSQTHYPGELREVCGNNLDDDCDGVTDEEFELINGETTQACWCEEGSSRACGSNIGACRQGYRICSNYQWSDCVDAIDPAPETCNRVDDDCDGVVDNIGGGTNTESTRCGCYGDGFPTEETCNDIDDDCDGLIDEGLNCCTDGNTRHCGIETGACTPGIQTCSAGSWGDCVGGIDPTPEICYDEIDNDCDGETDEMCDISLTCRNGLKDLNEDGIDCGGPCPRVCELGETPLPYTIMALAGVALIILAGYIALRKPKQY